MKYMGSKNRIAKCILPIMLAERKPNQWWVEPFVGGANMIDKVDGKRLGADINKYLIKALILVRDNPEKIPLNNQEYTEEMFNKAKLSDLSNPVDCFAMFQYSFGCIFKGSWSKNKRGTDYVKECVKNVLKQSKNIQGVVLRPESYLDLVIPENSLIYCDPPYWDTAGYKNDYEFNHVQFWQWCRDKTKEGHTVFVSEYNAPNDFECIWQMDIKNNMGNNSTNNTEKLFRLANENL
ncbi:DNA adenine methylase [Candidatus Peregrinibacteria bacterium]|nr:DNA adenine methylase [Candidatus Peregrinibacteria bacterium]